MYVLLGFWQKIMAIPIMNPLSWFMIKSNKVGNVIKKMLIKCKQLFSNVSSCC